MMDWKGFGKNHLWPNVGIIQEYSWRDCGIPQNDSVRISGVRADIRTTYFPNTGLEHQRYISLLGHFDYMNRTFRSYYIQGHLYMGTFCIIFAVQNCC
jgi:hypothetical protein